MKKRLEKSLNITALILFVLSFFVTLAQTEMLIAGYVCLIVMYLLKKWDRIYRLISVKFYSLQFFIKLKHIECVLCDEKILLKKSFAKEEMWYLSVVNDNGWNEAVFGDGDDGIIFGAICPRCSKTKDGEYAINYLKEHYGEDE